MNVARGRSVSVFLLGGLLLQVGVLADGTREDYARANGLRERYQEAAIGMVDSVAWVGKTHKFWYRHSVKGGHEFVLVDNAYRLQGALLLIVGEMDTNVDPSSTFQVVNQWIKHKKDFELLVVPGMGHGSGGEYGARRSYDFFVRNLLGKMPPAWNAEPAPAAPSRQRQRRRHERRDKPLIRS